MAYHPIRPCAIPRQRRQTILRLQLLAVWLSACGITAPPTVPDEVAPSAEAGEAAGAPSPAPCDFGGAWSVRFLVSGGLAGVQQELHVDSDGQASYTDQGANPTTWALGADDLGELVRRLELACPFELKDSRPSTCRDCFINRLEIVSGQNRFLWEADESQVIKASLRSLLDQLEVIRTGAQ